MKRSRDLRSHAGFTLIEVLVAMALLGVVAAGMLALTRGSLRFTGLSSAMSVTIEDIADAEGYLSDTFRNAKAVFSTMQLLDAGGSVVVDCDLAATGRCVAVLTPVQDTSDAAQPIVDYDLSVFSIEPIDDRYEADGLPRGWEDADTLALFEYRISGVCSGTCTAVPGTLTAAQRTWSGSVGYLVGGLSEVDGDGNPVAFFAQPNTSSLVINLVARADAAAGQPFVVRRTPVALQVSVRE